MRNKLEHQWAELVGTVQHVKIIGVYPALPSTITVHLELLEIDLEGGDDFYAAINTGGSDE